MDKRFVAVLIFALSSAYGQSGQIALKVRFVNVDRNVETDLGLDLVSTAPFIENKSTEAQTIPNVNQRVGIFLFRPDIDILATFRAIESRGAFEELANPVPEVMATDGQPSNLVIGRVSPFPILRGDELGFQFRQFGLKLNFLTNITPSGTIRLQVAPEITSLDFGHPITSHGFILATPTTRRSLAEVELESGQSFAISGLLDSSTRESLSRIHGLAEIPLPEKLFQSRSNTDLLVIITANRKD